MPVPTSTMTTTATATLSVSEGKNIWLAAGEGDLDRVKHLVDQEGVSPTAADEYTYTPLHAAASYGHVDILRFLLSHPNTPSNAVNITDSDNDTPLFVCESIETAKVLIEEFSADVEWKNVEDLTPALQAFENEYIELAEYFASITGEQLPTTHSNDEDDEEEEEEEDNQLDTQTDQLMKKVEEIMIRSEQQNFDPEDELKKLVQESLVGHILQATSLNNETEVVSSTTEIQDSSNP